MARKSKSKLKDNLIICGQVLLLSPILIPMGIYYIATETPKKITRYFARRYFVKHQDEFEFNYGSEYRLPSHHQEFDMLYYGPFYGECPGNVMAFCPQCPESEDVTIKLYMSRDVDVKCKKCNGQCKLHVNCKEAVTYFK